MEPDFRHASGTPEGFPEDDVYVRAVRSATAPASASRAVTAAELDDVFDNPDHGEPGRDRLGVHWIWETVLLVVGGGLAFALTRATRTSPPARRSPLMVTAAILGLLGLSAGLSLRAGAVNLAIGPIAVVTGLYFGQHSDSGFWGAAGIALLIAAVAGLAIAVVVTVLHVPAWAASLGAFAGLQIWIHRSPAPSAGDPYDTTSQGYYWFGAFAAVAIIGGVLGTVRPIRRGVGRFRPVSDPADRRGTTAAVVTGLAILGSALLAGLAGIGATMQAGTATTPTGCSPRPPRRYRAARRHQRVRTARRNRGYCPRVDPVRVRGHVRLGTRLAAQPVRADRWRHPHRAARDAPRRDVRPAEADRLRRQREHVAVARRQRTSWATTPSTEPETAEKTWVDDGDADPWPKNN